MDPNVDNETLAEVFAIELEENGFIDQKDIYGAVSETSRAGVHVAGSAIGPETIDDSIAQATAAAMSSLGKLKSLESQAA